MIWALNLRSRERRQGLGRREAKLRLSLVIESLQVGRRDVVAGAHRIWDRSGVLVESGEVSGIESVEGVVLGLGVAGEFVFGGDLSEVEMLDVEKWDVEGFSEFLGEGSSTLGL